MASPDNYPPESIECPTCKGHVHRRMISQHVDGAYHCPNCGTLTIVYSDDSRESFVPQLVGRVLRLTCQT